MYRYKDVFGKLFGMGDFAFFGDVACIWTPLNFAHGT